MCPLAVVPCPPVSRTTTQHSWITPCIVVARSWCLSTSQRGVRTLAGQPCPALSTLLKVQTAAPPGLDHQPRAQHRTTRSRRCQVVIPWQQRGDRTGAPAGVPAAGAVVRFEVEVEAEAEAWDA